MESERVQEVVAREHNVVTEISAIIEFAESRLDSIHSMVPTIEHAKLGFQGLEKLKSIVAELSTILDRGVNALNDEEIMLLARLKEIEKVKSTVAPPKVAMSEKKHSASQRRWGDESEDEVPAKTVTSQPAADRDTGRGSADRQSNKQDDDFRSVRFARGRHHNSSDRDKPREPRDNGKPKREYRMGSRIPKASPYPLMFQRRTTLDDIRGFQLVIAGDRIYGQMVSFVFGECVTKIGGVVSMVPETVGKRPNMCEPLLYEGKCQCSGTKLPPHAGNPVEVPVAGFVGIIRKFLLNYNGNTFSSGEVSPVHIDAVLLRCIVHAIAQLLGLKCIGAPTEINFTTFADVAEPRVLNAAIENYYRNRGDENPKAIARGLWIALATHFVSS